MDKVIMVLVAANISLWSFNAGTMYHMLERIDETRCVDVYQR